MKRTKSGGKAPCSKAFGALFGIPSHTVSIFIRDAEDKEEVAIGHE